ncbi:hypothetical protein ID866_7032, partial [Astraeus odoratus]
LIDIAKGLYYLHGQPLAVIHGNLKGANVLIAADGRVVITDYGLSSLLTSHSSNYVSPTCDGGLTSMVRWVSPEFMLGDLGVSVKGDIWSFGMTTLELFTAQPPFHNIQRLRELFCRIMQGPPDRPSDFVTCSRMTDAWWEICCMCWMRDPLRRPSISEILERLNQISYVLFA